MSHRETREKTLAAFTEHGLAPGGIITLHAPETSDALRIFQFEDYYVAEHEADETTKMYYLIFPTKGYILSQAVQTRIPAEKLMHLHRTPSQVALPADLEMLVEAATTWRIQIDD